MKDKTPALKGQEGFEQYYSEIYGSRWQDLKAAFEKENQSIEFKVGQNTKPYYLDSASVLAALSLPLKNAESVLDLCAAPGGKSLVIASRMNDETILYANERSGDRKHRLDTVISECLPEDIGQRVKTSCSDGSTWCKRQNECFDSILLDAPCSSERHVYLDQKYLAMWSRARIKTVSMEQWALLSCAYRLLRTDGYLLYSTCALSPAENDQMIKRLFDKFNKDGDAFELVEPSADINEISDFARFDLPGTEKTEFGYQILPDTQKGAGPIFFSLIHKKKSCYN